jgi:SAM-dependent methyltransferase
MVDTRRKEHWEEVYRNTSEINVSWCQDDPRLSLELIGAFAPMEGGRIIDVGGGASVLVDGLLRLPFERIAVLDISETALSKARSRLGLRACLVDWVTADLTSIESLGTFDIWHDRAVFHFLTEAADRRKYVELAHRTVQQGGHLIIATFADDGPRRCSDLDVCRYNARTLGAELGEGFSLVRESGETHTTPWGSTQAFFYGVFQRQ